MKIRWIARLGSKILNNNKKQKNEKVFNDCINGPDDGNCQGARREIWC